MKKSVLLSAVIYFVIYGCTSENKPGDKHPKRNTSITKENAYNNLFLDSAALENYISNMDTSGNLAGMIRVFYYDRNFEYAWFSENGLTEQAKGFWNLFSYYDMAESDSTLRNKALKKKMDALIADDDVSVSAGDNSYASTDMLLTEYFIRYMQQTSSSGVERIQQLEAYIPAKKDSVTAIAENLLSKKNKPVSNSKLFGSLRPQLQKYLDLSKKGGWDAIQYKGKRLKQGAKNPVVSQVKERLRITGEYGASDTTDIFTEDLQRAIQNYQSSLGYNPSGTITDTLIKNLNVPVQQRLEEIVINSYRLMWLPEEPAGKLIMVNIPEFVLHVYNGDKMDMQMNVVVGKEGSSTVIFSGKLNQVVFSPYWNVPQSIVRKEIVPGMDKDKHYLEDHHMEITGERNGLPVVRQLPGADNSLGKVKFLFPNSFNIYFHDTPAKSLFNKEKRAYSHGCIRLSEPAKLADYLLQDDKEWTRSKIDSAMNSGEEKYVALKKDAVPVIITYYTAWADKVGAIHFRDDIYGHDSAFTAKLFTK